MIRHLVGDALKVLPTLPAGSVHCCITSPPYWKLRSYLPAGHLLKSREIGREPTVEQYIENIVAIFREVERVLVNNGTVWLNLGDSYTNKNLVGIPWRVAFALQADGWYLRSDIIWHKPNCMPESVTDRPTRCHEYLFLFTKQKCYFYDASAIREPWAESTAIKLTRSSYRRAFTNQGQGFSRGRASRNRQAWVPVRSPGWRNKRSVWTVGTQGYRGAHFAVFPPELIRPCILAGCPKGGTVLDPFAGSGTTGAVAEAFGRNAILIDLNPAYVQMQRQRTSLRGVLFPNNRRSRYAAMVQEHTRPLWFWD